MFLERLPEFIANHVLLFGILAALLVALVAHEVGRLTRKYKALTPAQLVQLVNNDNALVVDVSGENDWKAGHITGSRHVAMTQFDPENKELARVRDLPVVIVDKTGQVSATAAERLTKAGFTKVYWLDGGTDAWRAAEMPLVRGK